MRVPKLGFVPKYPKPHQSITKFDHTAAAPVHNGSGRTITIQPHDDSVNTQRSWSAPAWSQLITKKRLLPIDGLDDAKVKLA